MGGQCAVTSTSIKLLHYEIQKGLFFCILQLEFVRYHYEKLITDQQKIGENIIPSKLTRQLIWRSLLKQQGQTEAAGSISCLNQSSPVQLYVRDSSRCLGSDMIFWILSKLCILNKNRQMLRVSQGYLLLQVPPYSSFRSDKTSVQPSKLNLWRFRDSFLFFTFLTKQSLHFWIQYNQLRAVGIVSSTANTKVVSKQRSLHKILKWNQNKNQFTSPKHR